MSTFLISQPTFSRLQYLDLSMTIISGPCLELLLSHCVMVRNLALENGEVNDVICSAIAGEHDTINILVTSLSDQSHSQFKSERASSWWSEGTQRKGSKQVKSKITE